MFVDNSIPLYRGKQKLPPRDPWEVVKFILEDERDLCSYLKWFMTEVFQA